MTVRTTDSSMAPRSYPAIGVTQIPNGQGTCQFITLHNGALTTSNYFKSIPMTTDAIRHTLAAADRNRVTIDAPFHIGGVPISGPSPDPSLPSEGGLRDSSQVTTTHSILPADETESQAPEPTYDTQCSGMLLSPSPAHHCSVVQQSGLGETTPPPDTTLNSHSIIPADLTETGIQDSPERESTNVTELASESMETHKLSLTETTSVHLPTPTPTSTQTTPTPTRTPSTRERKPPDRLTLVCMSHITAKRALKEDEENARPAIEAELRTMLDKRVFSPVLQSTLSLEQKEGIIRSHLNVTQKFLPSSDGQGRTKDRLKARLFGGSDGQDRSIYTESETSSPTVSTTSVLLIAQIAAMERRNVATIDIGSAYLNAAMPMEDTEKIVHMKLSPDLSEILIQMEATYKDFACKDGSIIVQLDRALYGCLQSALVWLSVCASGCVYVSTNSALSFKLNSFPYDVTSICISSTGQYQCATTYGGATSVGLVSRNFGVTWTEFPLGATSLTQYFMTCCISFDGKYMLFAGILVKPFISNNFGISFSSVGSVNTQSITSSTMNDFGTALLSNIGVSVFTIECSGADFAFLSTSVQTLSSGRSTIIFTKNNIRVYCNNSTSGSYRTGSTAAVSNTIMPAGVQDLVWGGGNILYMKTATSVLSSPSYTNPQVNTIYYSKTLPETKNMENFFF